MAQFDAQIKKWLKASEGGFVNHPDDPGGATNMGITFNTLKAWRGKSITVEDVRELTENEAWKIYKANYWDRVRGDALPAGLAYAVMDYAVNSGVSKAAKDLQRELGVGVDGIVGSVTLAAVRNVDVEDLIVRLCERRMRFLRRLRTFKTFGHGWTRRVMGAHNGVQPDDVGVIDRAVMRHRNAANIPAPSETPHKALPERPNVLDTVLKDGGGLSGIGGIITGVFGAIADQPILQVAAVAFIAFLLWRFVISKREADPA